MSIFEVRHQPRAHRLIQSALTGQRMPHAYIFHGPEGVGREMFAHRLARILLCEKPATTIEPGVEGLAGPAVDACDTCQSCRALASQTHPDLHPIYRELIRQHPLPEVRNRKGIDLGVDVIREFLINRVAIRSLHGRAKVFVVRDADRMTIAAQNALLKTLEEPPPTTHIVLIVTSLDSLLPTARSRCQPIPFGLLPPDFVVQKLQSMDSDVSPEEADFCARLAAGSLGVAHRHVRDGLYQHHQRLTELLVSLPQRSPIESAKQLMDDANELGDLYREHDKEMSLTEARRRGLKSLLSVAAMSFRDALCLAVGAQAPGPLSPGLVPALTPRGAAEAIGNIVAAERTLDLNANAQLCIEAMIIRLRRIIQHCA